MNKFVEMSTFISVVESLSFVGAAAKLGTSKSVVSQRVKMLEKRLGASLLERGPRLSLTEAGLLFYQECVRLLDEVTLAEEAVAPSRSELRGGLRIATSHTFMTTHLSTILAGFIRDHPGLSLDIATEDRQINMHQPDFDIAIRLGLVPDLLKDLGAVAHLHDAHAAAPVIHHLGGDLLQDLLRHHGGSGGEIIGTSVFHTHFLQTFLFWGFASARRHLSVSSSSIAQNWKESTGKAG